MRMLYLVKMYFRITLFFLFLFILSGCSNAPGHISSNEPQLDILRHRFAFAYKHFSHPKDSLKSKALDYLLFNIKDQYYYTGEMLDAYNKIILNENCKSLTALQSKLDSIVSIYGLNFTRGQDTDLITDSFLIKSIDDAFESWHHVWNKLVDFDAFCEYILPYKTDNERPEDWRTEVQADFKGLMDSSQLESNPFKIVAHINDQLHWFNGTLNYDYPVDIGYKMSKYIATGTCITSTRLVIYPMRYFGLPVVIDFAPAWGNRSMGHYWNALIYKGRPYPFDACGPNIGYYKIEFKGVERINYKIAKVFRKSFSLQNDELGAVSDGTEKLPVFFINKRMKDVTGQYVPVSDITLDLGRSSIEKKYAYLCVFDNVNWVPIYWGFLENSKIQFKRMGRDIVYLPSLFNEGKMEPIADPFILHENGSTEILHIDTKLHQKMVLDRKYPEDESNLIEVGDSYELFYWDKEWRSLGIQKAHQNLLTYDRVPKNTVYWLRDLSKGKQERIFTYEKNKQVWW